MTMRIKSQDELLDEDVRRRIIQEIEGGENVQRKNEAYKWHEIFKNKSKRFVRELLTFQLDPQTVNEMEYALSNISIAKKIVDKLARVYTNGVTRKFEDGDDGETENLNRLEEKLKINSQMKTSNKHLKLRKNAALYVKPVQVESKEGDMVWRPAWVPMADYLYDVVEMENDRTKAMAFILSNFDRSSIRLGVDSARVPELAATHKIQNSTFPGDGKDQIIADKKEDEGEAGEQQKTYIWWTDKYHFTTRGSELVDPKTGEPPVLKGADSMNEDQRKEALIEQFMLNPIKENTFVDMHIDQEGHYWAEGGEDLIDGDLLINSMMSNAHHIGVTQGFGQLVMIGKNLPQTVRLGPNKTINLPTDDDSGQTSAEFITANPPLDALAKQVEMYLALLLTTNNLSTNGVAASLQGGILAPSGIALAIDKAESLEDVQDQRDIFITAEKDAFRKTALWLQHFREENMLDPDFEECIIPSDRVPSTEFNDAPMIFSEKEKLENLKMREDLGINRKVEIIMKDRGVDEKEAEQILLKIEEEKLKRMLKNRESMGVPATGEETPPSDDPNEDEDPNNNDNEDDDPEPNEE